MAEIAVVGEGVVCAAGCSGPELWAAAVQGRAFAERHSFPEAEGWQTLVCRATGFDPTEKLQRHEIRRLDLLHQMAISAAEDAVRGVALPERSRCAVVVGVGWGASQTLEHQFQTLLGGGQRSVSPMAIPLVMANSVAAHLSIRFGFTGISTTVSSACASGASALGEAMWLLRSHRADFVLAGGVDAPISYGLMSFFARIEAMSRQVERPELASRPFDRDRDGFVLGEGGGFLALVRGSDAESQPRLGSLLGFGSTSDAFSLVAPLEDGIGATQCMREALADGDLSASDIGFVSAHGTSTVRNDLAESLAIREVFGESGPPVTALKGSIGHLLGGAGAVQAIAALHGARHLTVPPIAGLVNTDPGIGIDAVQGSARRVSKPLALSNSFGFGGHNACLVISAPPEQTSAQAESGTSRHQ